MAVAWRGHGTRAESQTFGSGVSPGDPTGMTSGDIQVLVDVLSGFGTSATLPTFTTLTTGWTQIIDTGQIVPASGNRVVRIRVAWALDTATDPTSNTNVDGVNLGGTPTPTNYIHISGRFALSGCDTSDPVDVSGSNAAESPAVSTSFSQTGITTTVSDAFVVSILGITDDNTVSAQAFANGPASLTERIDGDWTTTTGGDGAIVVTTGTLAAAGPTGNFTATMSADDVAGGVLIAFQEPQVASSGSSNLMLLGVG